MKLVVGSVFLCSAFFAGCGLLLGAFGRPSSLYWHFVVPTVLFLVASALSFVR